MGIILSCISIGVLILVSRSSAKNGFVRVFAKNPLQFEFDQNLGFNSYYISGLTSSTVYLGNITAPAHVLRLNYINRDTSHLKLPLTVNQELNVRTRLLVDSGHYYIAEKTTNSLTSGKLPGGSPLLTSYLPPKSDNMIVLSPESFVVRRYESSLRQNILERYNIAATDSLVVQYRLEKQLDGIFCTDGILLKDPISGQLVYVYFYRNRFTCLDKDLRPVFQGKTIDTVDIVKFKLVTLASDNLKTFASIPLRVNIGCSVYNGLLYVHSSLKADNQSNTWPHSRSAVDVYSIGNGRYFYSFYLPLRFRGKPLDRFYVYGNRVFALYSSYLAVYKLSGSI